MVLAAGYVDMNRLISSFLDAHSLIWEEGYVSSQYSFTQYMSIEQLNIVKLSKKCLSVVSADLGPWDQDGFLKLLMSELNSEGKFYLMVNDILGRGNHSCK